MTMIKMIIKMDDEKIRNSEKYELERIYSALDKVFEKEGISRKETVSGIEFSGQGNSTDIAYFGMIMLGLKDQPWFMDNVAKWLYCNSDDSGDPDDYIVEDLLVHYGRKTLPPTASF